MKKTLLFTFAILMSVSVFAQTRATFISEHFDGSSMPTGWVVSGAGTTNWSISGSTNAGGAANELHLAWSPQFNGTSRMVMPAVDLTGVTSVVASFKHALNNYSGGHTLGIATSSDGGATWNVGWQQSYSSSSAWSVSENITTPDMGNSNVQFCLFYTGNSYNINDWYFDDIEIFSQENLDLSLNSIDINSTIGAGNTDVKVTVQNKGIETINQITMAYQFDEMEVIEESFDVNMSSLATTQITFNTPTLLIPGTYNLTVSIIAVNGGDDNDLSNNTLEKTISVALGSTQKIAMIEHFSSSTCGPCVQPNTQMLNVTNNNPGKFTYTKYQMNWPGNGDPYYTEEGGVRRQYYSVNAVPAIFIEAQEKSASQADATINAVYNTPAFSDIRGSFNVIGNTINVKVDFMSYYDMTNTKAFATVNEKETHGNVGSNGETTFHHIFMKFLTSTSGDELNIEAGNYQHFEFTQDLSSTHVEEMSDLEVAAWMQIYGSKEMLNSHFMYEYTDIHPYPVENVAITEPGGGLELTWENHEGSAPLSYDVYVNGELIADDTESNSLTYECEYGLYIFTIQANYPDDMTSVNIVKAYVFEEHEGVIENNVAKYNIYPNPTNGNITVSGSEINMVEVYNLCGQKVQSVNGSQNVNVDMSALATGVYMVKVIDNNGNSTVNKVVKK